MPKAANNNMELWDRVSKTNPDYTKHVNMRGGFTAIDPHSQIQSATEAFGPAGIAWGWEILRVEYLPTGHVAQLIGLWHSTEEKPGVQQWGQASMYVGNSDRPDVDCMKKATTDGLTKCLSYLGFNADVFLGLRDRYRPGHGCRDCARRKQAHGRCLKEPVPQSSRQISTLGASVSKRSMVA